MTPKIDGLMIAAFGFLVFLGSNLISDVASASSTTTQLESQTIPQVTEAAASNIAVVTQVLPQTTEIISSEPVTSDPTAFGSPYTSYTITQGPHGYSYGHMAIDLAAGEDATIYSPINGTVVENYIDEYGNPTLVIENEVYQVTLLHGNYTASVGQSVSLGDTIGSESNQGYTKDMAGNLCWGRAGCGFHTHLNVFDKRVGSNVNPLDLLP
jgi:murein DD-endopeptidase MepM/ murein hydrolase activator NlpD